MNEHNLDDEEIKEIESLKLCSEQFIEVQFNAVNDAYKKFKDELTELLIKFKPEYKENEQIKKDFLKFYVDYLNTSQENFKKIAQNCKKKMSKPAKDIFDFNKWDNKYKFLRKTVKYKIYIIQLEDMLLL